MQVRPAPVCGQQANHQEPAHYLVSFLPKRDQNGQDYFLPPLEGDSSTYHEKICDQIGSNKSSFNSQIMLQADTILIIIFSYRV